MPNGHASRASGTSPARPQAHRPAIVQYAPAPQKSPHQLDHLEPGEIQSKLPISVDHRVSTDIAVKTRDAKSTITYVPTWAGFLHLAIVLDACTRRIVGWAMGLHLRTELVLGALNMALTQRRPTAVIRHSDHGCQ